MTSSATITQLKAELVIHERVLNMLQGTEERLNEAKSLLNSVCDISTDVREKQALHVGDMLSRLESLIDSVADLAAANEVAIENIEG